MYYLIEFENQPLYDIIEQSDNIESLIEKLGKSRIIVTDSFLESYFRLINFNDLEFFPSSWNINDSVLKLSDTYNLENFQNFILFYDKWEICAKLKHIKKDHFIFQTTEGNQIIANSFKQGDTFLAS
jgi:hypothetical protein